MPPTEDELLELYYFLLLTRRLDERCEALFKQGLIPGTIFSQRGHEAISVGSAAALNPADVVAPMHRDLGAFVVRGMSPARIIMQALGREGAPSRGRDVNTHGLGDLSLGLIGYVSHLPQSMGIALGAAFAFQYRGEERVALTYFGDGSASEGGAHEALNLAAVLGAPVIFILENNQYAYSTPLEYQASIDDLSVRADGYGIPGHSIDGNDVLAVHAATSEAAERARQGLGPSLIVCKTLRLRGHAIHDPADYVPRDLLAEWEEREPLGRFERELLEAGTLSRQRRDELEERVRRELDAAVEEAESSPWPDPATLTDGVLR